MFDAVASLLAYTMRALSGEKLGSRTDSVPLVSSLAWMAWLVLVSTTPSQQIRMTGIAGVDQTPAIAGRRKSPSPPQEPESRGTAGPAGRPDVRSNGSFQRS